MTLKEYRLLHGAHVRNPGALVYPATLRYMPAYLLGLVKSTAFRWGLHRTLTHMLTPFPYNTHPHADEDSSFSGHAGRIALCTGRTVVMVLVRLLTSYCCRCRRCCFRGTGRDVPADERSAAAHSLMAAPVDDTLQLSYPDVYDVSQQDGDWGTQQGGKVRAQAGRHSHTEGV